MDSIDNKKSGREIFIDKYVEYICSMSHVSKITKLDNYFYQLILFIHEGSEKYNTPKVTHKIKNNCLFVNKIFDDKFTFKDHGVECSMYMKYIMEYCPDEVTLDIMQGHTQPQTFYGCDFECGSTFLLIADKLKSLGYTKESLLQQQQELEHSKIYDTKEVYETKQKKYKQRLITTKNICLFIAGVK